MIVCVWRGGREEWDAVGPPTNRQIEFLQIDIHLFMRFQAALFFNNTKLESTYLQILKVLPNHF